MKRRLHPPAYRPRPSPTTLLVLSGLLAMLSTLMAATMPSYAGIPGTSSAQAGQRLVTFVNHVDETVWVAATPGTAPASLAVTGWKLPAGQQVTITVPNHWNGRFWGRTGCRFDAGGRGSCQTGNCSGRFECKGSGAIPATLVEYNLDAWDHLDFYDVSMVDGSNLPVYVNRFKGRGKDPISLNGCSAAGCTKAVVCPPALQVRAAGAVVGCISACARFGTDQYCCRGKWSSRAACNPKRWPVDYAAVFKRAEPFAYSYVYDDATSVFTCYGDCNYRITFGVTPARVSRTAQTLAMDATCSSPGPDSTRAGQPPDGLLRLLPARRTTMVGARPGVSSRGVRTKCRTTRCSSDGTGRLAVGKRAPSQLLARECSISLSS